MIKVFLILSAVVLLGAAVTGWMNREDFIETRIEKDAINEKIKKQIAATDAKIAELNTHYTKLNDTHKEFDTAVAARVRFGERTEEQQVQLNSANAQISTLETEKAKYDQAIESFKVRFPDIRSIDELPPKIESLKKEVADMQAEQGELTQQVAQMNRRVDKNTSTIETFEKRQADRNRGISLNQTEGTITAVNQDWGFAVINMGKNQGVTADSELIVKRGGEVVGKLAIVSIEPRLTVADIRLDTLKNGARILPGDKVIFEKLQE